MSLWQPWGKNSAAALGSCQGLAGIAAGMGAWGAQAQEAAGAQQGAGAQQEAGLAMLPRAAALSGLL